MHSDPVLRELTVAGISLGSLKNPWSREFRGERIVRAGPARLAARLLHCLLASNT
jgi:hypothetical protein